METETERGKVVGPNDIPVKELKYLGQRAEDLSTRLCNIVLDSDGMP